ncbi:putative serine carboxypeptidase-like 23 [Hordeum vulgare]|nr:putative serine carboxypeptidase-like 23 [Hordeum vulgare]
MQPMPMACLASSDEKLRPLHVGQTQAQVVPAPPVLPASPAEKHAAMPKSISIRSKGYLKHRVTEPVNVGSQQRVFVGVDGAKAEEHKGGSNGRLGWTATMHVPSRQHELDLTIHDFHEDNIHHQDRGKVTTLSLYSLTKVAGYVQQYAGGLTFLSVRGVGHLVPSFQPERALVMLTSFLKGMLPPYIT